MAVKFVIGRAGSGKTHRCVTSIVNAVKADPLGPTILWIVPRQATFAAERELACNTGLGGYLRVRVVSFEQLGHEVLAECGGASVPEITPLGRQMLIGHLLRREAASLKYFRGVARQPGLAAQLDRTFAEFERAGKDAGELDALLAGAKRDAADTDDALLDKVHDLQLIYRRYSEYVGRERFDQHRRLASVLGCIATANYVAGATVYCDGFREFSDYERRVLAALGKRCRAIEIALAIDPRSAVLAQPDLFPESISLFHPIEITYRRLRLLLRAEDVPVDEPFVLLNEIHRFRSTALQHVERHAIGPRVLRVSRHGDGIELLDAPTRQAEVDAAARRILDLVRSGCRLRDIVVLTRELSPYEDLISVSFGEHGIRYFTDRRRSMSHHPLLRCIRSILAVARGRWPHEPMMELLKTELAGLTGAQADELENFVLTHRIRGAAWGAEEAWLYGVAAVEGAPPPEPPAVDAYRRAIVSPMREFVALLRSRGTINSAVKALFSLLETFGVRKRIASWIAEAEGANRLEEMAEHQQVWTEVTGLFEEMVTLLGDETVNADSFSDILEAGLEQFDLALTPPTLDEVLVGELSRTRTPEVRAALVLGLNDGVFPKPPKEDSVLSDSDRRFLGSHDLDLRPMTERQALDEELLAYIAFTRASELLYVSRARSDPRGRPLEPSKFFARLTIMFPTATCTTVPREPGDDVRWIGTTRQLVGSLARWARRCRAATEVDEATPWPAVYEKLAAAPSDGRWKAWRALAYTNEAALTPSVAALLFSAPLHATAAELESFAACPFKHFLDYSLQLGKREAEDVSALDLGNVYHHVLERIVGELLQTRKRWADLDGAERDDLIRAAADEIGKKLRGEIFLGSARNRYLLDRIERTLAQIIQTQQAGAARGAMRPGFARLKFGPRERLPALTITTPRGREVRLSGKIDRVDLLDGGPEAAVVDYRLGGHALPLARVFHGIELQLLTYLLVLDAHGEKLTGRKLKPAAAFYVGMLRRLGDVKHPADAIAADDPTFHLQSKPRGLLTEAVVPAFDASLAQGTSDVIHCNVKKDGDFGSKAKSDLASDEEFTALLGHVKQRIGELADELLEGSIHIRPYLLDQASPCTTCSYRSVCRFNAAEGYRFLPSMAREDVLLRVTAKGATDGK